MNRATDLEARMDDGTTPLILAARHDLPDLVRHLIKAGVFLYGGRRPSQNVYLG